MGDRVSAQELTYKLLSQEEKIQKGLSDDPIVSLVDSFLFNAVYVEASDIHLEQTKHDMRVRFRIDGVLYEQSSISLEQRLAVLSRLKVLAGLDIAQKRVPQDGKIRLKLNDKEIDVRVSTFPSIYGEKIVLRILDGSQNFKTLESLGLDPSDLNKLNGLIRQPYGFILVTGPTGSGKTTSLYSILSTLNNSERNIITMEDPVEYNLDGIVQSQVNPKAGFTFENGLRSILRQDPDVVMVGEIRDKQTAQIAIEAALTGHLVFSTLHTNDASSAVTRLIDMGIEPFLINAALSGVLAQRLCRKLCSKCKCEVELKLEEKNILNKISSHNIKNIFKPAGCKHCFNLGYKGRTGIFELLLVDDNIRNLIVNSTDRNAIKNRAVMNGMNFLIQDAASKVKDGVISLEELVRIVGEG